MEDEEYKKLPIEDKCVHKLWKARVCGYEEVTKLFRQIDDEKSPEFGKYLGLVKKFVTDSNAMGQEKGLEATLAYVENYAHAGKTVSEVMSGVVAKCIAAPKTKTRELALQLTLMYIEIEKFEAVEDELIKGMELKNPKIVTACVNACTTALREFGSKVINVKPLLKKISVLLADRDKSVRDETKLMIVEMYRWIGASLRLQLQAASLQPVQITELETEFAKIEGQKAVPTRYIRSQQVKQAKLAEQVAAGEAEEEEEEAEVVQEIDPYELASAVEILSKMPKDFYENVEAKKWQDRKDALEAVENLVKTPKLENGDYGDLVRALKKVIQKDSNVVCVAIAGRCIAGLANGLKKKFQTYSGFCVSTILEKFKEKKQNVVSALRDAIDAVYLTTNLEAILEDVLEALNNKNPSVKIETSLFLARAFTKTPPTSVNKKLLKAITAPLTKNINESDQNVREASAEALGTLMKLVGEKTIAPFLVELEKDNLKMAKIKEFCDNAVILVKTPGAKKEKVAAASTKAPPKAPATKPDSKKPAKKKAEISSGTATVVRSKGPKTLSKSSSQNIEKELADEEVDSIVSDVISASIITDIASANWKLRLAAAEQLLTEIKGLDSKSVPTQALTKFISKKPGLKDTNFQALKAKLDVIKYLAENTNFTITSAGCCVAEIAEKFSDAKNGTSVAETLSAIAEATTLGQVSDMVLDFAFGQRSPKVQQEALVWLSGALKEFGFSNLNIKCLIDNCKKALGSTNPAVRQSAISLLGVMYLYMGATLNVFFENEKPALRDQINAECDKYEGEKPPIPTRGVVKSASTDSLDVVEDDEPEQVNIQDLIPRVDISGQITETILTELSDKNWKARNEAVTKIAVIINEAKFIKPNLGDLPQAIVIRLTDSNVKIAQSTLGLCDSICKAMGPPFKQHIRTFFPAILQGLGDSKASLRASCMDTINAFSAQCGYKEFFEGEMIADALKSGSPSLRIELWNWLAENVPKIPPKQIPKEELVACIPHLYTNLEDRNAEVRKNAQEAILGIMIHLGYEFMAKQTEKLKPGSKTVVLAALEKVRPNLPVKPLPTKKAEKEDKAVRGTKPVASGKNAVKNKPTASNKSAAPAQTRKKDDDIDTSPLLVANTLKLQRILDEQKLRVLKWNFTQPREEFVDLLKDQMSAANVNKTLLMNMFHSDFRYHIKALESLSDDLADNSDALIANLDLILKWLTLRFFDTNPSVLLKGLEYLQFVFNMLIESKYRMLENEVASFVPYLINKIGDPKDSVRNGVKALLNQLNRLFPINKLSLYIMDGVKSKNARQRAECLEVMGGIIEDFGITVCMPTPAACLKEVAKQISDRDNSVRSAALNCVLQAYNIVGEKVYKLVGNISDKDMSLLEERIKRSSRKTMAPPKPEVNTTVVTTIISPQKENTPPNRNTLDATHTVNDVNNGSDQEDVEEDMLPPVLPQMIVKEPPKEIQGPFKLDPEFMEELEKMKPEKPVKPNLKSYNLDFLSEEIRIPTIEEARAKVQAGVTSQPVSFGEAVSRLSYVNTLSPKKQDPVIERLIKQMASQNPTVSLAGMTQLHEILAQSRGNAFVDYEDDFMNGIIFQFQQLQSADLTMDPGAVKMYRNVLTTIDAFYNNKTLGSHVSVPVIKELMLQMITLLVEERLNKVPNGDAYVRVINLHCVKVIERSDHTNTICALVKLINESIGNSSSPRLVDLVMKCLWRVIKLMPQWGDDIDYDSVLLEIHNFLKKYPSSWWKNKEVDTPLRTVKTVLHSSAKIKGGTIMLHFGKIPNTSESEVETYILRILKSLKISEIQHIPVKQEMQRRSLSRANHKMLTDIFQKIGSKDETKEGLNLLYDFMQQHPEADIEPFLSNSSKFFQDYIKNGLKDIEDSRKPLKTPINEKGVDNIQEKMEIAVPQSDPNKGPDYWKERLNMWNRLFDDVKLGRNADVPE
ncbi:protein mini spindles isoform X2 [Diorhabda sublineata]|uniref:protein mini spindles isoform X2 n=1 Tax=Diorhabda sublineata TaxID=1163346 RepID=UPI0024E17C01|nr:protein mini spindles isoform X2 [Diorhabda sublineata]